MLVRTQIQLTEGQFERVRRIAHERGTSVAAVIREAIENMPASESGLSRTDRLRRTLGVIGRFRSGLSDVGRDHDRYLDEIYGDHNP